MTVKTTTRLTVARTTSYLDRLALPPAFVVAVLVFIVAGGISAVGRYTAAQSVAAVLTPSLPVIILATAAPAIVPPTAVPVVQVAAVLPNALRRAVVAYDAPAGNVIGGIEPGRAYQVLARFGAEWLQVDVAGSGVVWLKADQVLDVPAGLADLQPPIEAPAPQIVYQVVSQDERAPAVSTPTEQSYQAASEPPQPTPAPAVVRKEDFTAPDPKARCQFVGCLHVGQ